MISRTTFCSAQAAVIRAARIGPMPVTSRSRSGSASMMSNTSLAEGPDQLLGVDRADAADHAGAEILLDALDRGRRRGPQEARPELLAVGAVVDPFARRGDPLAGGDRRGMADDGDQVAVAARLDPEHAEAVLGLWKVTRSTRPARTSVWTSDCCRIN